MASPGGTDSCHHSAFDVINREHSRSWTETTTETDESNTSSASSNSLSTQQHQHQLQLQQQEEDGRCGDGGPPSSPPRQPMQQQQSSHHSPNSHHSHSSTHRHVYMDDCEEDESSHDSGYEDSGSTTSSCIMHHYVDDHHGPNTADPSIVTRTDAFDLSSSSHSVRSRFLPPPTTMTTDNNSSNGKTAAASSSVRSPDAVNARHAVLLAGQSPPKVKLDPDEYLVRHWNAAGGPIDFNSNYDWGHWNDNRGSSHRRQSSRSEGGACYSDNDAAEAEKAEGWLPFEQDEEACELALAEAGAGAEAAHEYDDAAGLAMDSPRRTSSSSRFPPRTWSFPPREHEFQNKDTAAVLLSPVEKVSQLHQRRHGAHGAQSAAASASVDVGAARALRYNDDDVNHTSFSKTRRKRRSNGGSGEDSSRSPSAVSVTIRSKVSLLRNGRLGQRLGRLFLAALLLATSSLGASIWYLSQTQTPSVPTARSTSATGSLVVDDAAIDLPAADFRNEIAEKLGKGLGGGGIIGNGGRPRTIRGRDDDPPPPPPLPPHVGADRGEDRFTLFLTPSSSSSSRQRRRPLSDEGRMDLALNSIDVHSGCPQVEEVRVRWPEDVDPDDTEDVSTSGFFGKLIEHGGGKVKVLSRGIGHNVKSLLSRGLSTVGDESFEETTTSAVLLLADDVVLTCEEMERAYQIWKQNPDRMVGFYGYRHIPGPDAASQGAADGYSIVSDRAAFVHRDLLTKLAAENNKVGGAKNNGVLGGEGNLIGSPCQDIELSVRITALTSRPPIVVAGRPLELRSERDVEGSGVHGDASLDLDQPEWAMDGQSCLSDLMQELGQDDLPVEERMYIGPQLGK